MARSPISSPQTKDRSLPPPSAVAGATDEVVWALIQVLIEKRVISADDLASKLRGPLDELRRPRMITGNTESDRFATALAIERVVRALEGMS